MFHFYTSGFKINDVLWSKFWRVTNSIIRRHCCQLITIFMSAFMCELVKWCHFCWARKPYWYILYRSRWRREKNLGLKGIFLDLGTISGVFLIFFQTSQNLTLFLTLRLKNFPIILPRSLAIFFLPSCLKSYPRVSESYRLATVLIWEV